MTLDVLIFGPAAAAAGADRVRVRISGESPVTVADVLRATVEQHPSLRAASFGARLAVNHAFAEADVPVEAGDELALIAMVSGG